MPEPHPAPALSGKDIQRILPHRYPFLLLDRVTEFTPGERIVGVKTFSADEPYQRADRGIAQVPCGILLETVTQLGAVLVLERPGMEGKIAMILQIPAARMHAVVQAGDTVQAEAVVLRLGDTRGELRGLVRRDGAIVAEGQMRFAIASRSSLPSGGNF